MENWVIKRARLTPNAVAVSDGETSYTFAQVLEWGISLGAALDAFGVLRTCIPDLGAELNIGFGDTSKAAGRDDTIDDAQLDAIIDVLERSQQRPELIAQNIALLAGNTMRGYLMAVTLLLRGKTVVWLNRRLTDEELLSQMQDAGVSVCLCDDDLVQGRFVSTEVGSVAAGMPQFLRFSEIFALARAARHEADTAEVVEALEACADERESEHDAVPTCMRVDSPSSESDAEPHNIPTRMRGGRSSAEPDVKARDLPTPEYKGSRDAWAAAQMLIDNTCEFAAAVDLTSPRDAIPHEFADTQVVSVMFTSGSTGRPKGIKQTVRNHFTSATSVALSLGVQPGDEWLCTVPIFHISGYSIVLRGLIFGATVRLVEHFDAGEVAQALADEPITWISVVPTMLKQLVALRSSERSPYNRAFKGFILGGEKSDVAMLEQCAQLDMPVVRSYGMTETCSQVVGTGLADSKDMSRLLSVGKPYFTTQLRLAPLESVDAAGGSARFGRESNHDDAVISGGAVIADDAVASGDTVASDGVQFGEIQFKTDALTTGYIQDDVNPQVMQLAGYAGDTAVALQSAGTSGLVSQRLERATGDSAAVADGAGQELPTRYAGDVSGGDDVAQHAFEAELESCVSRETDGDPRHISGLFAKNLTADGWYRTGDVGHMDAEGYLYVDGRLDNMLISGGENVHPEEIERVYADCPGIAEIAVTAESDEHWGQVPVAYVVCAEAGDAATDVVASDVASVAEISTAAVGKVSTVAAPASAVSPVASSAGTAASTGAAPTDATPAVAANLIRDDAALRQFGREHLAHYKVPHRFYRVASLPKTSTGKVQRFRLGTTEKR